MIDRSTVVQLYQEGRSGLQIAESLGVTYSRIYQILRAEEVPRRPCWRPKMPKAPRIKLHRDRVVDRILRFLATDPGATVAQITVAIDHANQGTVGAILSRLKRQGAVVSVRHEGDDASCPYLWSLPKKLTLSF